ncbi:MAG: diguanylate cyclase [Pseudomonadales bacterium]|nr:diguanylate cyclase [Pseudomonadales bacterium]MCP5330222.1 diguanylate cyclase [Pseudomonadales bacterium]MCP5344161.1 diguanylate cyclase [Pseudomonadales bacterium]
MSHRDIDNTELDRWKKKFLDALEVHDRREKSLTNRIRLLRRGLVSVSLAGDGLDTALDKELAALRTMLRAEESEAGIDLLLERIEKSVLRLDSRKEQSHSAIQHALNASIKQLQELDLPRELKRSVRQFAKSLPGKIKDAQNHSALLVEFLELLRAVVRELTFQPAPQTQSTAESFWTRLFSGSAHEGAPAVAPAPPRNHDMPPSVSLNGESARDDSGRKEDGQPEAPGTQTARAEPGSNRIVNASGAAAGASLTAIPEPSPAEAEQRVGEQGEDESGSIPEEVLLNREAAEAQTQAVETEEEPISSEPGPGFSVIANHAEPVLLRILENIYVPEQSGALASKLRARINKGLNWYEFVSVLEDIHALIIAGMEEERAEFQRFLNELNESLGQVQEYVQFSREQANVSQESEKALDEAVRSGINDIAQTVQGSEDIGELKNAVQSQLSTIISSMDQFRALKSEQQQSSQEHARQLEARLQAMEVETQELRLHLARQEQMASRDALTELPNRAAYDRRIQHECEQWRSARAAGRDEGLCLVVGDVDHFKRINDTYGHLAGDKVLKIIAKEISSNFRQRDFIARYGGEEFVIVMPSVHAQDAESLINSVRQKIERCPFHFREKQVQITMSFGLTEIVDADTPEKAFERADKALYHAKEGGRNQVCVARLSATGKNAGSQ